MTKRISSLVLLALLVFGSLALGGELDPIEGALFEKMVATQHTGFRTFLDSLMTSYYEAAGVDRPGILLGPENRFIRTDPFGRFTRLIVRGGTNSLETMFRFSVTAKLRPTRSSLYAKRLGKTLSRMVGQTFQISYGDKVDTLLVQTIGQFRFLKWIRTNRPYLYNGPDYLLYAEALVRHLDCLDHRNADCPPLKAPPVAQPGEPLFDFYAPPPEYIIEGYQNYKDSLKRYASIETSLISAVKSFELTKLLADSLKALAPKRAFPNKEVAGLQLELKKFLERGGSLNQMQYLTTEGYDTLLAGEYFFAVSLSGAIRFGRELTREEVKRIEETTGQKPARANHAFLFPGEYLLTAGAFFIEMIDGQPAMVAMNAGSGHFFYSNIVPSIVDDLRVKSDEYLLTIGHLLQSLDSLNIPYDGARVSKF